MIIHVSILTISIGHIRFLRDVLRAYSFISRKHAFGKIEPPLTSQIAENKILGPIPLDPHEKVSMDWKNHVEYMAFRIYGEKNIKTTCSNDGIPYYTPWLLKNHICLFFGDG